MIPWHNIDTVLLDMDGTLLDLHFDNYFWLHHLPTRYAQAHGVSEDQAKQILHEQIHAHEGTLKWYCLQFWSDTLRLNIRRLKEEVKHKIQVRPFAIELLQRLRQLNKKAVLITNAHPDSLALKLEVSAIDQWLDLVISSHHLEHPKENQEFWQRLRALEPFDPERTLFVDDTPRILAAAQTFGIRHLLCIRQPDSQHDRRYIDDFPAIDHFDEILPPMAAAM